MEKHRSETQLSGFDAGGDRQDALFDALSNTRRRIILHSLQTAERPVSVGELTTDIAAREVQQQAADGPRNNRDAITVSLVHNHLPMMAGTELIRYDDAGQTVALADHTDEVEAHLQTMANTQH